MPKDLMATQWQTVRVVTAADTALTDYKPDDITAAVKLKMISVYPANAILLRGFGQDTADQVSGLKISGWMNPLKPNGTGPGYLLWSGVLKLGAFASGWAGIPITDGKWGASATWLEVDAWTQTAGSTEQLAGLALQKADSQSCLLLPTLGYTHLLFEFVATLDMTKVGLIWRPVSYEIGIGHTLAVGS